MSVFASLTISYDARLWRLRGWLLERAIVAMSGDLRWALLALACASISARMRPRRRPLSC